MRKSILFCSTLFICGALMGCGAAPDDGNQAQPGSMAVTDSPSADSSDSSPADSSDSDAADSAAGSADDLPGTAYVYTTDDNIIPMSESATIDGIACQILGCEVTSVFGDRTLENLNYFYEEEGIDDKGNLLKDQTYIFITFQYTNTSDAEAEFIRGTNGVYRLDDRLIVQDYTVDAVYIDELWLGGTESETHHYRLKPGESITSEVGYIVDRDFVKDSSHLYFALKQSDCMTEFGASTDPDAIFVRLEYAP